MHIHIFIRISDRGIQTNINKTIERYNKFMYSIQDAKSYIGIALQ